MKHIFLTSIVYSLLFLIIIGGNTAKAQQVVATAGTYAENQSMQISWTIGEPVIKTISDGINTLTQGMHQSKLIVTTINELQGLGYGIIAYPNPATDFVIVKSEKMIGIMQLYDINGKMLRQEIFNTNEIELDLSFLPSSTYFIQIVDKKKIIKTFKIIKQ